MTAVASLTNNQIVVDHTLCTQLQRKLILHWFYWSVFLVCRVPYLLSKSIWRSRFATIFAHSQQLVELFIFSGKSSCCSNTFAIYIAANKEHLKRRLIIVRYTDSAFPQLYYLKFSFKSVDVSKRYAK